MMIADHPPPDDREVLLLLGELGVLLPDQVDFLHHLCNRPPRPWLRPHLRVDLLLQLLLEEAPLGNPKPNSLLSLLRTLHLRSLHPHRTFQVVLLLLMVVADMEEGLHNNNNNPMTRLLSVKYIFPVYLPIPLKK